MYHTGLASSKIKLFISTPLLWLGRVEEHLSDIETNKVLYKRVLTVLAELASCETDSYITDLYRVSPVSCIAMQNTNAYTL